MFRTKLDNLHDTLDNFTPLNKKYENYVSSFDDGNCCTFVINKDNIRTKQLYNEIRKCGFEIVARKKINNTQIKIVAIEIPW